MSCRMPARRRRAWTLPLGVLLAAAGITTIQIYAWLSGR